MRSAELCRNFRHRGPSRARAGIPGTDCLGTSTFRWNSRQRTRRHHSGARMTVAEIFGRRAPQLPRHRDACRNFRRRSAGTARAHCEPAGFSGTLLREVDAKRRIFRRIDVGRRKFRHGRRRLFRRASLRTPRSPAPFKCRRRLRRIGRARDGDFGVPKIRCALLLSAIGNNARALIPSKLSMSFPFSREREFCAQSENFSATKRKG